MSCDNYHFIGQSHRYCQDYSRSGEIGDYSYAIISDGCSQSHEFCGLVDMGASLLSQLAYSFIRKFIVDNNANDEELKMYNLEDLSEKDFLRYLFYEKRLKELKEKYDINDHAFDATLILCISYKGSAKILIFGDGAFCVEKYHKLMTLKDIYAFEYDSGAPYYMNYLSSISRNASYLKCYGSYPYRMEKYELIDGEEFECVEKSFPVDKYQSFLIKDFKNITIFSDGVMATSFKYTDLINELTNFKNYNGEYIYRRVRSFLKKNKDFSYHDDISIASIHNRIKQDKTG